MSAGLRRFMKRAFLFIGIILTTISAFAQNEAELVNKVKAKLDKVNDYKAEGIMSIDVPFIKAAPSAVAIYYKKPSEFRIKKEGGISILPKGGLNINISTILSMGKYTVVPSGEAKTAGVKTKVVKLVPEDETTSVILATLFIDETNLVIRKSIVTTRENGTYEMEMNYGKYSNWGLPDKVIFSFNTKDYKLPKGVTFEYESGEKKSKPTTTENKKGKVEINYSSYSINKGIPDSVFKD